MQRGICLVIQTHLKHLAKMIVNEVAGPFDLNGGGVDFVNGEGTGVD